MEWFEGSVDDALNEYQKKQGVLVVYVYAENDENSYKFDKLWESFDPQLFGKLPYIAIRLLKESEGAKQFAQFFPTLTIPVCYILGLNAQPLEVITTLQELDLDQMNASFRKAIALFIDQAKEGGISIVKEEEAKQIGESQSVMASVVQAEDVNAEGESKETEGMSKEEKLEYYRKLLEEKKKADAKKNEEEERMKEIQRRNEGKTMAEFRAKQQEKELRESAEARRKQKEDDAAALKRIRDQLKVDKEERAKRNKGMPVEEPEEEKVAATSASASVVSKPINTDECRIQCRFPDGSTLNLILPSKEPLRVVHDAVDKDSRKPNNFFLVQSYPRVKLTELDKSLLDYGLTPSSVILVIAAENGGKQHSLVSSDGYLGMLLGFIYIPFVAIYQFFLSLTAGVAGRPAAGSTDQGKQPPTKSGTKKEEKKSTGTTVKDGNIQRFHHEDSDHSDKDATWNGNSTQQL